MKLPKGMPQGLAGGPPWRKAIEKVFTEACQHNKGAPSVFCFPNKDELMAALEVEQYGLDMTGEMFLMDVYVVFKQLMDWPSAWWMVMDVMDPKHVWTRPFCDKIIGGSPWFTCVPVVRRSFMTPRHTMAHLEKDTPAVAAGMNKWLDMVRVAGNTHTQRLLKEFWDNDASDMKTKEVHGRPLMRLMQQVHAKVIGHIFSTACKGSVETLDKLQRVDANGMTVLHHVASLGDAAGAKAVLKAIPKSNRTAFLKLRDIRGYSAEDWARLGDYEDLVEALKSFDKPDKKAKSESTEALGMPSEPPPPPLTLFPKLVAGDVSEGECPNDGSAEGCASGASDTGGWQRPADGAAPPGVAEWMPPADAPCDLDVIDMSQFDYDVFSQVYLLHSRPLLIRGGSRLGPERSRLFSRESLLEAAGDRKIEAQRFATEREYDATRPMEKTLREYIEYLDSRSDSTAPKKLHYMATFLDRQESYLNFSASLPSFLADKVEHTATQFYLGGALMGYPPHHHSPTVNSLVYGRKLWFLDPPGRELVAHENMYQRLLARGVKGGGSGVGMPQRCIQEAGDIVFIPRSWTHATLLLQDSVGMSHQFTHNQWDLRDS